MNLSFFISRRLYTQGANRKQVSHSAITISTAGIALGLAIMIITLGVVLGFKHEVRAKVISFGSHMQLLNYNSFYSAEYHPIQISDSLYDAVKGMPGVKGVSRFCMKQGVLKTDDAFQTVSFRGLDENYELSFLQKNMQKGEVTEPFSSEKSTGRLYISQRIAQQLQLEVGQKVYAYFFDQRLRTRRFTVEGIYQSGLNDLDRAFVFCDYATAHQLLGIADDQCSGAEITLSDFSQMDSVGYTLMNQLAGKQDAYGQSYINPGIQDMYPNIFSWLNLLDINVIVIFLLMMLVAGFSTISGLLIIILERVQFIGVMKALGTTNGTLRNIFGNYAMLIALRGMVFGNILGIGLCLLQQHFGIIKLDPTVYYVEAVPILMDWTYILLLNVGVAFLIFLALLLPTLQVSRIQPAKSIRFE